MTLTYLGFSQAIKAVRSAGLIPDLIACRCEKPLEQATIDKVARFCQVPNPSVLAVRDMPSTYQVPILLHEQNLVSLMTNVLRLDLLSITPVLEKKGLNTWETWKNLTMGTYTVFSALAGVVVCIAS